MGVTFSQAANAPGSRWVAIIQIEGLGAYQTTGQLAEASADGTGQARLVQFYPDYRDESATPGIWRNYLKDTPGVVSERGNVQGGLPDLGQLSFKVVDADDYLTLQIQTQAEATTAVSVALNKTSTSVSLESVAAFAEGDVIFIGAEAMRVTAVSGSLTVARGYLGTDALSHPVGAPVFVAMNFLRNRRAVLKLGPADATDASEEVELGTYAIQGVKFEDAMCTWAFQAKSQLKFLAKLAPFRQRGLLITGQRGDETYPELFVESVGADSLTDFRIWRGTEADDENFYLKAGTEILTAANIYTSAHVRRRGVLQTEESQLRPGQFMPQVFVAEDTGPGSFRYSPGPTPSTSRSSGSWTKHAHPLRIALTIMLSSHDSEDGLELNNRNNTYGAYDILPPGYGLGIPHTLIDWPSWDKAIQRTSDWRLPNFVYGGEPAKFSVQFSKEVLEPLGIYLVAAQGKIRVVLPRIPVVGESSTTITEADVLLEEKEPDRFEPRISVDVEDSVQAGSVIYYPGPKGQPTTTFVNGDFDGTYGQRGHYTQNNDPVDIRIPGADPGDPMLRELASGRILRWHRPALVVTVDVTLRLNGLFPGDPCNLTHQHLATMKGTRGWTSVACEVLEREIHLPSPEEPQPFLRFRLIAWPSFRVGRFCPAAYVSSVASTVATCAANRFTETDAAGGRPTADAAAFTVGDVVRLVSLAGVDVGAGTEEIENISGNDITLSGNFSGNLASGNYLIYANADDALAQQTDSYVFFADRALGTVGSTFGGTAWRYGSR